MVLACVRPALGFAAAVVLLVAFARVASAQEPFRYAVTGTVGLGLMGSRDEVTTRLGDAGYGDRASFTIRAESDLHVASHTSTPVAIDYLVTGYGRDRGHSRGTAMHRIGALGGLARYLAWESARLGIDGVVGPVLGVWRFDGEDELALALRFEVGVRLVVTSGGGIAAFRIAFATERFGRFGGDALASERSWVTVSFGAGGTR